MLPTFYRRVLLIGGCAIALCASRATRAASPGTGTSLDERIILVPPEGSEREDRDILLWQKRVTAGRETGPGSLGIYERLGWSFVAKARRTLDAGYYKLAEKTADVMDARFGSTDEALLLRGHVYHNLHRFQEAESVARTLVSRRGLAFDFALLSDALMEQGKLTESVAACGRMMALKPGLEAYSRAANLRWLTGDLPGAIEAMEGAVRAGSPLEPTNTAWTLSRLSLYYLQAGRAEDALRVAESAARAVPDYPPALLARGRALVALGHPDQAVDPLGRAERLNPLPEYQWWLADALRAAGQPEAAASVEEKLKLRGEASDPRTYSLFLATRGGDSAEAVRLARAELTNRADVFTQDALAWALASGGDYDRADAAMRGALAAKTKDARLFLHAGEIAMNRGEPDSAKAYFGEAAKYSGTLTPSERTLLSRRLKGDHAAAEAI
jgi:tetratricopeptide (TPR) repeat protein